MAKNKIEKFTPNRSQKYSEDVNGIPYVLGNHKKRRIIAFKKNKDNEEYNEENELNFSKAIKLPKELWEKGKSKFLSIRLSEEKKKNINQLYF